MNCAPTLVLKATINERKFTLLAGKMSVLFDEFATRCYGKGKQQQERGGECVGD